MELRRSQQSPDSVTQQQQQQQQDSASQHHKQMGPMALVPLTDDESANASNTHLQHHQHHHLGHLSSSSSNSSGHHTASTFPSFNQAILLVKEEDHHQRPAAPASAAAAAAGGGGGASTSSQHLIPPSPPPPSSSFLSMEQLCWPSGGNVELMESMSPESADLCRNLSSQLETFRSQGCSPSEGLTAIAAAAVANAAAAAAAAGHSSSSSLQQQQQRVQHRHLESGAAAMNVIPASSSSPSLIPAAAAASASVCDDEMLKAAIVSHPHYPELVVAHMNCHKVGASPELVSQIDEIIHSFKDFQPPVTTSLGANPELDQFMVSYYNMLQKYEKEVRKTFKEAVAYCKKLEQQLRVITNASVSSVTSVESDERNEGYETSEDEESAAEVEIEVDPMAKDKELKEQLMRKYSGYISSLKHEFLKKKKKGKLPKDSRQQLLNWWTVHYKWPYPSESEKASLAESTGLDQKQINNWFINQRKRHWKPSDELNVASGQTSQSG